MVSIYQVSDSHYCFNYRMESVNIHPLTGLDFEVVGGKHSRASLSEEFNQVMYHNASHCKSSFIWFLLYKIDIYSNDDNLFIQVIFQDIFDTYPNDSDIITTIKYPNKFVKSEEDKVLLFEVGWSSVNDYVYAAELKDNYVKLCGKYFCTFIVFNHEHVSFSVATCFIF